MSIAYQSLFNLEIVSHVHSFRVKREVQWEEVESSRFTYETKHITMREWHGRGGVVFCIRSGSLDGIGGYSWLMMMSLPTGLLKNPLPSGGTAILNIWQFYLRVTKRMKLMLMMTAQLFSYSLMIFMRNDIGMD